MCGLIQAAGVMVDQHEGYFPQSSFIYYRLWKWYVCIAGDV